MLVSGTAPRVASKPHYIAIGSLVFLFLWVYGRFAFSLYFAMDDFINSSLEMTGPLLQPLRDSFNGTLAWSGYRPLTIAMRVLMTHAFGLERMWGYYVIYLGMHLANTLLTYRIVRLVSHNVAWSFFAAAIVLLLPSHNEAVFWFAANANVLALVFALLTLDFALTSMAKPALGWQLATAAAYICAVLSYEVTVVLPILILLAEWALWGRPRRKRLWFYVLLTAAIALLLVVRLLAQGSLMGPSRADYAVSLDPATLLRGYLLIAGQMLLLYTSPFPDQSLYAYARNWLNPTGWVSIVTFVATVFLAILVFVVALRRNAATRSESAQAENDSLTRRFTCLFWFAWGLLWIISLGVAFAGLVGRNPENRYTYLLSFGMAVSLTALLAWLYNAFANRRALRSALLGLAAGLLAFYAYVSVSDGTDWAKAGQITRSVQTAIVAAVPTLDSGQTIAQIGVPAHVGTALTYALPEAFSAAINLQYGSKAPAISGFQGLRAWLKASPENGKRTFAFIYGEEDEIIHPLVAAVMCSAPEQCTFHELRRPDGIGMNSGLRYVELYEADNPQLGGTILLATLNPYVVKSCFVVQDYGVALDPNAMATYPYDQRCSDAIAAFWDNSH